MEGYKPQKNLNKNKEGGEAIVKAKEDYELVQRILSDESNELFEKEIIDRYKSKIRSICFKYINNTNEMMFQDDIMQYVLLNIRNKLSSFDGNSPLENWIYVVTKNACNRFLGREVKARNKTKIIPYASFPNGVPDYFFEKLLSLNAEEYNEEYDDEQMMQRDFVKRLYTEPSFLSEVFGEKKEKGKNIFVKHYIEGLTEKQICEELGIPENHVRSTLTKVRNHIFRYFKKNYEHLSDEEITKLKRPKNIVFRSRKI